MQKCTILTSKNSLAIFDMPTDFLAKNDIPKEAIRSLPRRHVTQYFIISDAKKRLFLLQFW